MRLVRMRGFAQLTLALGILSSLFSASGCGPEGSAEKPISTSAQSVNVDLVGRGLYGPCGAVFVKEDYAYVGAGGLCIVNVSDPSNPYQGGYHQTAGHARNVLVHDGDIYVADVEDGLFIFRFHPEIQKTGM
jgi:hypothetical protein